jgi:hypothetical protein
MRLGLDQLEGMKSAIESGEGRSSDYWADMDRKYGLDYENGYQRVYDAFYGQSAIRLTKDGTEYDIVNGRHRIAVAKEMGIDTLPARVIDRVDPEMVKAAEEGIQEGGGAARGLEKAALVHAGRDGSAMDLNDAAQGGRYNFRIYDVANEGVVASVKCYGLNDGSVLKESTVKNYLSALCEAQDGGSDPHKFRRAAADLQERAQDPGLEGQLPPELASDPEGYLREHAELWVPQEHAEQIRNTLREQLYSQDELKRSMYAQRYHLDAEAYPEEYHQQVETLLGRVKGVPISTHDLTELHRQHRS